MSTPTNIIVGLNAQSTLKAGAYGTTEANATDLGFIKGGITIEHEESSYEVKVDQCLGIIDKITTAENLKIKFSLAEATLENIALAFGYTTSSASIFEFGDKSAETYKTLYINVKGPNGASRKYTFWKCRPTGKTSQSYKRDSETLVEVEFDVLCDTSKAIDKRFGKIEDITSA
jgi:hypothetical protein